MQPIELFNCAHNTSHFRSRQVFPLQPFSNVQLRRYQIIDRIVDQMVLVHRDLLRTALQRVIFLIRLADELSLQAEGPISAIRARTERRHS